MTDVSDPLLLNAKAPTHHYDNQHQHASPRFQMPPEG